jgi:hypothetical protein
MSSSPPRSAQLSAKEIDLKNLIDREDVGNRHDSVWSMADRNLNNAMSELAREHQVMLDLQLQLQQASQRVEDAREEMEAAVADRFRVEKMIRREDATWQP